MVKKMSMNVEFTKKTKDYNLNTSLKNYIDPRIYKSWCDYVGLDWKKLYTTSLQGSSRGSPSPRRTGRRRSKRVVVRPSQRTKAATTISLT